MSQHSHVLQLFADVKEHVLYLQELGVESLNVDLSVFADIEPSHGKPKPVPVDSRPEPLADILNKVPAPPASIVPEIPKKPAVTSASKTRPGSRIKALPSLAERPSPVVLKSAASSAPPSPVPQSDTSEALNMTKAVTANLSGGGDPTLP